MSALIEIILPVFLVIGAGYLAVKLKAFPESGVDGLMKFTQHFAIPCLLFKAIAELELGVYFTPALLAAYYVPCIATFVLGMVGARMLFGRPLEDSVAIGFACMFANSVLLGLPITERAYGSNVLDANYAIIAFHAPFCYLLGISAMEVARARGTPLSGAMWKVLNAIIRNSLFIGITLGFLWNLAALPMPGVVDDALTLIARAALPAALFALGCFVRFEASGMMHDE